MSYKDTVSKHLRITLLKILADDANYTVNESILTDETEPFGYTPSRDRVRTELFWLQEQGLVVLDDSPGIIVATLTERGLDVAKGRAVAPGVKRPSPKPKGIGYV